MASSLAGKVITLTGGASGIGAATAKILAARGAKLALADVSTDELEQVAQKIRSEGNNDISTTTVDIRDRQQVKDWIHSTIQKFGPLDGAANIAGVAGRHQNVHHIWELSTEEFDLLNDVNSKGLFHCLAEMLTPGVMKDGGSIASVASICGLRGLPRSSGYCASKHAAVGLIKSAAIEAGPSLIRVNGVAPGLVETPMLQRSLSLNSAKPQAAYPPISRNGQPEEVGELLAFLLGDGSKYISGSIYSIDGAWNA